MPRNIYISHGTQSERDLLDDLIAESIQVYGHDVVYIPRKIIKLDGILNEDVLSKYTSAYVCEMYVESVDGFEGDGKLITKFGLEIRDQLTLVVSVRRWNQLVGRFCTDPTRVRPMEGDLIYMPMTKGLFEIKFVEDKKPFFQLNDTPTYKLIVELFEYGNQDLDTGLSEIDDIQSYSSLGFAVLASFTNSEFFAVEDILTVTMPDGITATCELLSVHEVEGEPDKRELYLGPFTFSDDKFHRISTATALTCASTGFTATIDEVHSIKTSDDELNFGNDDNAQNSEFAAEGQLFIDFSEANPFGDPDTVA